MSTKKRYDGGKRMNAGVLVRQRKKWKCSARCGNTAPWGVQSSDLERSSPSMILRASAIVVARPVLGDTCPFRVPGIPWLIQICVVSAISTDDKASSRAHAKSKKHARYRCTAVACSKRASSCGMRERKQCCMTNTLQRALGHACVGPG